MSLSIGGTSALARFAVRPLLVNEVMVGVFVKLVTFLSKPPMTFSLAVSTIRSHVSGTTSSSAEYAPDFRIVSTASLSSLSHDFPRSNSFEVLDFFGAGSTRMGSLGGVGALVDVGDVEEDAPVEHEVVGSRGISNALGTPFALATGVHTPGIPVLTFFVCSWR